MTQTRKPVSIFPDYPRPQPAVDKQGNLTPLLDLAFSSLFQGLQTNYKNEGILIPKLDATQIADIQALYTPFIGGSYQAMLQKLPDISGQMVYNTTINGPQIFVIVVTAGNVTSARWWTFTIT